MKLPFPYARWDRAESETAAEPRVVTTSARSRNGDAAERGGASTYDNRIETLHASLREEGLRIASDEVNDLAAFDRIAAEIAGAMADYRSECAAAIEIRSDPRHARAHKKSS